MEVSKCLPNLQLAGLIIQNSLKSLTASLRSYNKRKTHQHFAIWKFNTIEIPKNTQVKIKNSMSLFVSRLKSTLKSLNCSVKSALRDSLTRIVMRSKYANTNQRFQNDEVALKSKHQEEFQLLNKEIKSQQDHLDELDMRLRKMKQREDLLKNQIQETSAKKNDILKIRKKTFKDKENELSEKIEELKEENSDLRAKIAMIENNVSGFIGEMGGLLKYSEAGRSSDKRKTSVKKNRYGKKGKIPVLTVDISKS